MDTAWSGSADVPQVTYDSETPADDGRTITV